MTERAPIRQSSLGQWDACPLSYRLAMESDRYQPSDMAAGGTLGHAWVAWALQWMVDYGERRMPVEMGMEGLQKVLAQRDIPDEEAVHLTSEGMERLRIMVTKWCEQHSYSVERIAFIEKRFSAQIEVRGPNDTTYTRTVTGKPDVILTGPGRREAGFVDQKFGWAKPSRPREVGPNELADDRLSSKGIVQQLVYSWLLFENFPSLDRVWAREFYVMWGEVREASYERWEMERIRDTIAAMVANIDAAVDAGPESKRWVATPGTHCAMCPNPRMCPIREEVGIPTSYEEAQQVVAEWHVAGEVRKERAALVKGAIDRWGPEIELPHAKGRRVVGYKPGSRSLSVYEPGEREVSEELVGAARSAGVLVENTIEGE